MSLKKYPHNTSPKYNCGIIGSGKLATALAVVLSDSGFLKWVLARSLKSHNRIKKIVNPEVNIFQLSRQIETLSDIIIIAVSDNAIESIADELSRNFQNQLKGKYVIHCSAVMGLEILSSCRKAEAVIGSLHPFQTFYYPDINAFNNICWGINSSKRDYNYFADFVKNIDGKPYYIGGKDQNARAVYHLAAVLSSNILSSVIETAKQLSKISGIPTNDFLKPIIETSVMNSFKSVETGGELVLTGPIIRADLITIQKHLDALGDYPELNSSYRHFSLALLEIGKLRNSVNESDYLSIRDLLSNSINK